jgi:ketosteroid isomerase-like protein
MEEGKSAFLLAKERLKAAKAATKSMKADRRALSEFSKNLRMGQM